MCWYVHLSFGYIQIEIVVILLSWRPKKGINTLKWEIKINEQEKKLIIKEKKINLVLQEEVKISKEREEPGCVFWGA